MGYNEVEGECVASLLDAVPWVGSHSKSVF